jgi:hypothetical protein
MRTPARALCLSQQGNPHGSLCKTLRTRYVFLTLNVIQNAAVNNPQLQSQIPTPPHAPQCIADGFARALASGLTVPLSLQLLKFVRKLISRKEGVVGWHWHSMDLMSRRKCQSVSQCDLLESLFDSLGIACAGWNGGSGEDRVESVDRQQNPL